MAYKVFSNGDALTGGELNTFLMNQSVISFATTAARDAALTAPLEGQLVWLEDSNKYVYYSGSAWTDLIVPASAGNAIINGAMEIWQRGTSFSAYSAGGLFYTADRWATQRDGSGATVTTSQQTFTPGAAPVAGYESQFFIRVAQSVAGTGGTYNQLLQRIEDVRTLAGQTTTVSFWAKADSATGRTMQPVFIQNFGSGGSADVLTYGTAITLSTSWARYTQTITMPSVSGKTIGAGSAVSLSFFFPLNIIQTYDIWGVQLEAGSSATPFRRNGANIGEELASCQRYTKVFSGAETDQIGFVYSTTGGQFQIKFPVTMRVSPTLSSVTASNFTVFNSGFSGGTPTAIAQNSVSPECATINTTTTAGSPTIATNQPVKLVGGASAQLIFSAEL
jgi:hypothetical protein